ncbi:2,3,4,5-tetrahydropyridine-2,6-dicarboxylate N-succinyltransferase [Gilvimarinus xylanilyticus]|uniref:2,3,4,5-tetrahydropyridine-2,6-dicarboxylate N-succinyltransferase n=1 Tax=Gilvimarinus xylanilyticus TaxID=2944139 RepID=A0A9X2KW46_9GAMM|nr:2,3,4,5-tetrahydropyridine-2,6-dicarboxylate N-succinyltransferase [Gilvimarinus xylanilyticus]MCP8898620.1 2,3,4,5-tetrahydropyridine-2,6-dicarboxylate N-succinyltransferase [Gilvimarinus xylanilyticus]
MTDLYSVGLGVGTQNSKGEWLDVFYPAPLLAPDANTAKALADTLDYNGGNQIIALSNEQAKTLAQALSAAGNSEQAAVAESLSDSQQPLVATLLAQDEAPASVPEGFLKLHLISHRLVKPHGTNLTGLFGALKNLAWTNQGPIELDELPQRQLQARLKGEVLEVACVDKFPKMTNYVVPTGVRIAHTARVRLGAYLGEGTTIMHEGFVNFNAGTAGPGMIEGRISAGVFVESGSDLGGGSSTMGTLSGGGNIVIKVGKECLLGANAGTGIPLGDRCTIESGLYITAGTKVAVLDDHGNEVEVVKARDLADKDDLLFRRNSQTGRTECLTNKSTVQLNEELHKNA